MKCFLDLDGVLSDFHKAAFTLHGIDPFSKEENLGNYRFDETTGLSQVDFFKPITKEFWAELPRTLECDEILSLVEKKFGRENICILTAPPEVRNLGCLEGKEEWIYRNLPQYIDQFLIGKPKAFCAGPNSVLIDDSDSNIKAFREAGGRAITFPRPWNSMYVYRKFPLVLFRDWLAEL